MISRDFVEMAWLERSPRHCPGGREVEKGVCFLNMMRLFTEGIASTVLVGGASIYSTHLYRLLIMDHCSRYWGSHSEQSPFSPGVDSALRGESKQKHKRSRGGDTCEGENRRQVQGTEY